MSPAAACEVYYIGGPRDLTKETFPGEPPLVIESVEDTRQESFALHPADAPYAESFTLKKHVYRTARVPGKQFTFVGVFVL